MFLIYRYFEEEDHNWSSKYQLLFVVVMATNCSLTLEEAEIGSVTKAPKIIWHNLFISPILLLDTKGKMLEMEICKRWLAIDVYRGLPCGEVFLVRDWWPSETILCSIRFSPKLRVGAPAAKNKRALLPIAAKNMFLCIYWAIVQKKR